MKLSEDKINVHLFNTMDRLKAFLFIPAAVLAIVVPVFCAEDLYCKYVIRDYKYACDIRHVYNRCQAECDNRQLSCYSCSSVERPESCTNSTMCGPTQKCLLVGFIDEHFQKRYKVSCADSKTCSDFGTTKRSTINFPGYCCNHDNCNHLATAPSIPVRDRNGCEDISTEGCRHHVQQHPNVCDHHHSNDCPVTCGFCKKCYSCNGKPSADTCNQTMTCETGKQCFIESQFNYSEYAMLYTTGCATNEICTGINQAVTSKVCCNSSLCNVPSIITTPTTILTTTPVPTTIPTTTPVPTTIPTTTTEKTTVATTTTQIPTTHVTYPTLTCGLDFVQVGGACYYFNPEGRTESWEDASVICMVLGGYLAEFETTDEEAEMKKYLFLLHGNDRHYSYWTGGHKNTQTGQWTWNQSGLPIQHLNWYGGKEMASIGHDCLEFGPMYDYTWNNGNCKLSSNFICEKNLTY